MSSPGNLVTPDDPVDSVLRIPHPAHLVGVSLGLIAALCGIRSAHYVQVADAWSAGTVITLVAAAVAALAAAALLTLRHAQTMPATLAGLVLLDVTPAVVQFASNDPTDARALALFLLIPTVIAASSLTSAVYRIHLAGALTLVVVMMGIPDADRSLLDRIFESAVAGGVLLAAALLVRRLSQATADRIFQLRKMSLTDELTGVLNRRGFAAGFRKLIRTTHRDGSFGMLIADIDHFKWFNDEYGHAAGDVVLRRVCQALVAAAGPGSLVARIGGEEVAALLPGPAEPAAQAFRAALAKLQPTVTVSVGVVDVPHADCTTPDDLRRIMQGADQALYEAKNTGRDRVCRGVLGARGTPAAEQPAPAPHPAAVEPESTVTAPPPPALPGLVLIIVAVTGLASTLGRHPAPPAHLVDWIFLTVAIGCLAIGLLLIVTAPWRGYPRLVAGALCADLVIALAVLDTDATATKFTLLLLLLLTGLMVAQYATRPVVLAHHLVVGGVCLLVLGDDSVTPVVLAGVVLHVAVLVGSAELIFWLRRRLDAVVMDLHRWSVTDPLTGLANRRGLEMAFARMSRAHNITILALDVDDFKAINDRHGHAVGDDALIRLAATLRTVTGPGTVVGRTGGDEFVVLAPAAHAGTLTARVSRAAALLPVPLSISVGSTVAARYHRATMWDLVAAADTGLTTAKRARRAARGPARLAAGHPTPADQPALDSSAVMASDEGSSAATSTTTVCPSVM